MTVSVMVQADGMCLTELSSARCSNLMCLQEILHSCHIHGEGLSRGLWTGRLCTANTGCSSDCIAWMLRSDGPGVSQGSLSCQAGSALRAAAQCASLEQFS